MSQQRRLPHLHRLRTLSIGRSDGYALSSSLNLVSDYVSPTSQSSQNEDVGFMDSPLPMYSSYSLRTSNADSPFPGLLSNSRGPTSCPNNFYPQSEVSSNTSSHQNLYDMAEVKVTYMSGNIGQYPIVGGCEPSAKLRFMLVVHVTVIHPPSGMPPNQHGHSSNIITNLKSYII